MGQRRRGNNEEVDNRLTEDEISVDEICKSQWSSRWTRRCWRLDLSDEKIEVGGLAAVVEDRGGGGRY